MKNKRNVFAIIIVLLVIFGIFYYLNISGDKKNDEINSFDNCVIAGNPVMESYPRQCRTESDELFTEEIEQNVFKDDEIKKSKRNTQKINSEDLKSKLDSLSPVAKDYISENPNFRDFCASPEVQDAINFIDFSVSTIVCNEGLTSWIFAANLRNETDFYCVDLNGVHILFEQPQKGQKSCITE